MSPVVELTCMFPCPFVVPPHVGSALGAFAVTLVVVTNSSWVKLVDVPIASYATAKRPYVPVLSASK